MSISKIYKNSFILTTLRVIEPLMSLLIISAISRILGTETLGAYSFINSLTGMFGAASQMGLHALIVREVAHKKNEATNYLSSALLIGLCTSILLAVIMNVSVNCFDVTQEVSKCITIMSVTLLPVFVIYTFESIFVAFERMDLIFIEQIFTGLIRVVVTLLLIFSGYGIIWIISTNILTTIVCVFICFYLYKKNISKTCINIDMKHTYKLLKITPVFLLTTIVSILSARIDILILTKLTDMTQVALYSAAYRVLEMCMILPLAYFKATFPQLSSYHKTDTNMFLIMSNNVVKHTYYYMLMTIPLIFLAAPFIIYIIYGDKFTQSIILIHLLLIGLIPWGGARIFANLLVVNNLQRLDMIASIIATIANILLNLFLVQKYGVIGAAIANTCSFTLFFLLELYYIKRSVKRVEIFKAMTYPSVIALAVLAVYYITKYIAGISFLLVFIELSLIFICMLMYLNKYAVMRVPIKCFIANIWAYVRTKV